MLPYLLDLCLAILPGRLGVAVGDFFGGSVGLLAERSQRRQAQYALGWVNWLLRRSPVFLCNSDLFDVLSRVSDGNIGGAVSLWLLLLCYSRYKA